MIKSKTSSFKIVKDGDGHQEAAFFQLAGHQECFKIGLRPKTILKKATGNEESCLRELMKDKLAPFVPKVFGIIKLEQHYYLELQDLLANFNKDNNYYYSDNVNNNKNQLQQTQTKCSIMDIKMGFRTCREDDGIRSESGEPKLRPDMYDKMIEIDINEPTEEENKIKGITKQRYMIWRDNSTSSSSLGFRIEGMRFNNGNVDKAFHKTKSEEEVAKAILRFANSVKIRIKYLNRLYYLRKTLLKSKFFQTHEFIGSSLLFVHNDFEANIWIIDFAKTNLVPKNLKITHTKRWEIGNFEDGYLIGIDNLIRIFESTINKSCITNTTTTICNNITINEETPIKDKKYLTKTNAQKETFLLCRTEIK